MSKTKGRKFNNNSVSMTTFLALVIPLVGFLLTCFTLWMNEKCEVLRLYGNLVKLNGELAECKEYRKAAKKVLGQDLLPQTDEWEKRHNEHPIQFYVTDHLSRALPSTTVLAVRNGQQVVTDNGGLAPRFWARQGDKISVSKEGLKLKEIVLDPNNIKSGFITVCLSPEENKI